MLQPPFLANRFKGLFPGFLVPFNLTEAKLAFSRGFAGLSLVVVVYSGSIMDLAAQTRGRAGAAGECPHFAYCHTIYLSCKLPWSWRRGSVLLLEAKCLVYQPSFWRRRFS